MPSLVSHSSAGFIPAHNVNSRALVHSRTSHTEFGRQATQLWQAFNKNDAIPEFDPDNMGKPPSAHPQLAQNIADLETLPAWSTDELEETDEALFQKLATQKKFSRTLTGARLLAGELYSMWGDEQSMSLLQLVGRDTLVKAYEKGDKAALERCAIAFTVLEADHAVRQSLGSSVAQQPSAAQHYSDIKIIKPDSPQYGTSPVLERYNAAGKPELHVQPDHPNYEPCMVLATVARNYQNYAMLSICSIHEIANLVGESLAQNHLEIYYTLSDSPIRDLCRKITTIPEHPYLAISAEKCDQAYEHCLRHFGDSFMKQALFGNTQDGYDVERARQNLSIIVPKLNRFLNGEEADWC